MAIPGTIRVPVMPHTQLLGDPPGTRSLLSALAENGPVGVLILNSDGTVGQENARFRRIADATADGTWVGYSITAVSGFSEAIREAILDLVRHRTAFRDVEGTYERPDGTRRMLVATGAPARDRTGHTDAAFITFIDTTTWRTGNAVIALEADVQSAEAAFRNAALGHADALTLLEQAVERFGMTLGASVALGLVSGGDDSFVRCAAWPPDASASVWDIALDNWPALRNGAPVTALSGEPSSDELIGGLGVSNALLLPVDGAAPGIIVLGRDCPWSVAEVAAGSRLAALFSTIWAWAESEARFQRTVSELDDALFTFGFGSDGRREYAFITPQVEALTGLDPDALLAGDESWTDLIHPEDRERFDKHETLLRDGEASRVEVRIQLGGAEVMWLSERATPSIDAGGRPIAGGLLSDITTQKEAEAKLERARSVAERAAQTRMAFLRLMSHELRTPLGAIKGFAQLLVEEVQDLVDAPPEVTEFANTISESTDRALSLVSDLLDLSNLETGSVELKTQAVDLAQMAQSIVDQHLPQAVAGHVELSLQVNATACARADHERVEQVVAQLVSNAITFSPGRSVHLACGADDTDAWIEVEDTGVGMAPDFLEAIFEPFAQEDTRVNRSHEGTGLGLAIASRLARQMSGRLEVSSEKGAGSRFRLALPVAA